MNGRVYDYNLGRFMSVDPLIQSPANSQSMNPYSYIMNNPLSGADPTGYCSTDDSLQGCADSIESGTSQAITDKDGNTVGHVGKDKQGNLHITSNGSSKGQAAVNASMKIMDIGGVQEKKAPNTHNASQNQKVDTGGGFTEEELQDLEEARNSGVKTLENFQMSLESGKFTTDNLREISEELGVDINSKEGEAIVLQRIADSIASLRTAVFVPNTPAGLKSYRFTNGKPMSKELLDYRLSRIGLINAFVFPSDQGRAIFIDSSFFNLGKPMLGHVNRLRMKASTMIHEASHFNRNGRFGTKDFGVKGINNAYDFEKVITKLR